MNADANVRADYGRLFRGPGGNVLLMSMRRRSDLVGYCACYEFEDVIAAGTAKQAAVIRTDICICVHGILATLAWGCLAIERDGSLFGHFPPVIQH